MLYIIRNGDNVVTTGGISNRRDDNNIILFSKGEAKEFVKKSSKENLIIEQTEYQRKKMISIQEFEDLIKDTSQKITKYDKDRYDNFIHNGYICNTCGLVGNYFWIERNGNTSKWHMNLYGIKNGFEVMLTKDHIMPKSLGGPNNLHNYQTLCKQCNQSKGNRLFTKSLEK